MTNSELIYDASSNLQVVLGFLSLSRADKSKPPVLPEAYFSYM